MEDNARGEKRGFLIVSFDSKIENIEFVEIPGPEYALIEYDATGKNSTKVLEELTKKVSEAPVEKRIVLLKVSGELSGGNISDIDFIKMRNTLLERAQAMSTSIVTV